MQSGLEEHAFIVISDVSTLAGSNRVSTKQCDCLVRASFCITKLPEGRINAVLGGGHQARE